ncbi:uncharacterized protein LY89DRAFT_572706 [Mollisia scopiformis]|uniref:FAD-binding PCMH-type domain-containing protein n=1 Tax=Mollisia scopiformis TaxID=149040 RepID=A0A194XV62_MOLSC|nr:uncharacterized protein LY89DRAFT_572706 [Mollisia scopiformis]KUJ24026.1 hypothetical protein LY89DRAFT_572706 [Mollisia scopiformis]
MAAPSSTAPSTVTKATGATKPARTLDTLLPVPPKENLTTNFVLEEIIAQIDLIGDEFPAINIPLLKSHLWDIKNRNVNPELHLRGFLKVFEKTQVYKDAYAELDQDTKQSLDIFVKGGGEKEVLARRGGAFVLPPSPAVTSHFKELERRVEGLFGHGEGEGVNGTNGTNGVVANGVVKKVEDVEGLPRIFEDEAETRTMEVHARTPFHNWGLSVENTPLYTFIPRTIHGLTNLVKYASANGFRVRCAGYRHSWSTIFSADKQILISLLNLEEVTKIPDPMSIEPEKGLVSTMDGGEKIEGNEFMTIELVEQVGGEALGDGEVKATQGKQLCRVGVSVTNEMFRRWAVKGNKWSLPVDVILVEVTIGGVNGPICHGAGRQNKTVNDYVRAVEYIDCNGIPRLITSPAHLRAAAGHFGLLGIITHITFELDPMSYALLSPVKPDIGLAIPPLARTDIPIALRKTWTDAQYAAALKDFENRATNDYYAEWFWFTRSQQAWVNTWNPVPEESGSVEYPSPFLTFMQWIEGWLGQIITSNPIFQAFPGRWQAAILSTFGMVNLPPFEFSEFSQNKTEVIKCTLPNALHFRRGIQNMRVRDLEFQIPIPGGKDGKPDFDVVRRAWWDIIKLCYEDDDCPMRLTMEMRIMGDSNLIMAPQSGNRWGTASIEVLSIMDAVGDDEWVPFLQQVADLWLSYRDQEGALLNVRPHWAKEWESINMRGLPARQYLKEQAYKDAIPEFKSVLADIGKGQGWELKDIQARFSNELWDYMIYS